MEKTRKRISENAEAVGIEVLKRVSKGKKVVMGEIMREKGYSLSVSKMPIKVRKTQSYQNIVKPTVDVMKGIREKALKALDTRNMSGEDTSDLTVLIKNLTHDIQLISGGETERVGVKPIYSSKSVEE